MIQFARHLLAYRQCFGYTIYRSLKIGGYLWLQRRQIGGHLVQEVGRKLSLTTRHLAVQPILVNPIKHCNQFVLLRDKELLKNDVKALLQG